MSFISKILIWFTGADIQVLENLATERRKFVILGFSILITTLLAFFIGYYSFSFLFSTESKLSSLFFGLIYASLIFSIDFISFQNIDFNIKSASKIKAIIGLIPIFITNILIAFIISYPFNFVIFRDAIKAEKMNIIAKTALEKSNIENKSGDEKLTNLKSSIELNKFKLNNLKEKLLQESQGEGRSGVMGRGPSYKYLEREIFSITQSIDTLQTIYNIELKNQNLLKKNSIELLEKKISEEFTGLYGDFNAFNSLTQKDSKINFISYVFFLAILLFKSIPLLNRLFFNNGEYEKRKGELQVIQDKKSLKTKNIKQNKLDEEYLDTLFLGFNDFFTYVIKNIDIAQKDCTKKANNLLTIGILVVSIGLLIYAIWIINWLNILSTNSLDSNKIYLLAAGTIFFLLFEGFGAWFLKQYKFTLEKAHFNMKLKTILERQYLTYLFFKDLDKKTPKHDEFKDKIIEMLKSDIQFPEISENLNNSFIKESFETLTNLTETVKKVAAK